MFILVELMAVIHISTSTPTGLLYVLPDDSTNVSCPSQPCASINQYSLNMSNMSNVKFIFLSGKHSLTSTIIMRHVYNVTMVGVNYDSLVPAVIYSQSARALISFVDASNITIANLVYSYCEPMERYNYVQVETYFSTCYYCNITNVTLIRYGLVITNLLGESFLHNIFVYSHATEHCLSGWCYQGIEIINYGNNPYNISSNLHISRVTITGNGSSSQTACRNKIIGMHIYMKSTGCSAALILNDLLFYRINIQPIFKVKVSDVVFSLWIKNCEFLYNDYKVNDPSFQGSTVEIDIPYINVKVFFINCIFYRNVNLFPLVSIYNNTFHHSANCLYSSYIQFRHSTFIGNMSPIVVNFSSNKKSKCLTHFSMIGPLIIKNNRQTTDVISIYYATVNIIGEVTFSSNAGAKNIILFYYCNVMFHKNIYFIDNGGIFPNAVDNIITLQSDYPYITVMKNANIEFINNIYTNKVV